MPLKIDKPLLDFLKMPHPMTALNLGFYTARKAVSLGARLGLKTATKLGKIAFKYPFGALGQMAHLPGGRYLAGGLLAAGGVAALGGMGAWRLSAGRFSPYAFPTSPMAAGRSSGSYAPYAGSPMQFGAFRRSYLDSNATGSLAFALHNMR